MNPWLNKQAAAAYHGSQEEATRKLLKSLLETPRDTVSSHELEAELYFAVSAILLGSLYGYEAESPKDTILVRAKNLISYLSYAMLPSNCMVNSLPVLRYVPEWFPGAGWKREAAKWRKEKETLIDELYSIGLENMRKGKNGHLLVALMRSQALKLGLTEEEADDHVKHVSITMLTGGADTTVGQLVIFFLAMVLYPEVQKKAQEELDTVVGNSRLPKIEDQAQLGYIERILQETLRWGPIGPIAAPHTCFKDDMYKGYFIPKGAIVFGNVWAMTRDETVYKNPDVFDPDRFLDPSTPIPPVFGRCPGMHFGEASLFIAIASILMIFNIGIGQDENGKDVPPSGRFANAMLLTPQPFVLKITPRSAGHAEPIRSSC
ncbi:unnamed protein product [Rhizoctonia solani]|uniref:O-methylsterigmatocystin oxidoreductase n=1 Tax=Rhizoctonia solani TaxID=456999 RepID=A0A8H3DPS4_9AGAM|nr:unnamed protein product [Rhizoctonia solani]